MRFKHVCVCVLVCVRAPLEAICVRKRCTLDRNARFFFARTTRKMPTRSMMICQLWQLVHMVVVMVFSDGWMDGFGMFVMCNDK